MNPVSANRNNFNLWILIFLFTFIEIQFSEVTYAQKRSLDFYSANSWPSLVCRNISNNGRYFSYNIVIPTKGSTLVVESVDDKWKKEIHGIEDNGRFTVDSKRFIYFSKSDNSICILDLNTDSLFVIKQAESEIGIPEEGNGRWLVYRPREITDNIVVYDLKIGVGIVFPGVKVYRFNKNGTKIVMSSSVSDGKKFYSEIRWLDLNTGICRTICSDCEGLDYLFDETGSCMAILTNERMEYKKIRGLRYYKEGEDSARKIIDLSFLKKENINVSRVIGIGVKADKIFFYLEKTQVEEEGKAKFETKVYIKTYKDEELRIRQIDPPRAAVILLNEHDRMVLLQSPGDDNYFDFDKAMDGDYALVKKSEKIVPEKRWCPDVYLISVKDGTRKLLAKNLFADKLEFSLGGRYVVWYDRVSQHWFSYNIFLNALKCITGEIRQPMYNQKTMAEYPTSIGIAGWLEGDSAILIYDQFDIWRVDLDGFMLPVNITKNYGKRNKTELRSIDFPKVCQVPIQKFDSLRICGFSLVNKFNSYYLLSMTSNSNLHKLSDELKVFQYFFSPDFPSAVGNFYPLKAKNKNVFLVQGMTATNYPNLFLTCDFRNFRQLTDLAPQREYNWYTTELVHWTLPDGRPEGGILYKPENFNLTKKYPLIIYCYEKSSDGLNLFIDPDLSNGCMNIPWFVSNGYLVFVPDIEFTIGHPGRSAYNSIVSAALSLSKKVFVDAGHMGLQGHSYGGYEVNYTVTRTGMFASAATAEAVSDIVGKYGEDGQQSYYETGQGRIGFSLWKRPDLYIENSAVFWAHKVSTPILILQNENDMIVGYSQGEEWYNSLSRLRKKVWMLSYEGEDHTLEQQKNRMDYSVRLAQFFDHYLKGAPAPKWMLEGGTSLDLDWSGKEP